MAAAGELGAETRPASSRSRFTADSTRQRPDPRAKKKNGRPRTSAEPIQKAPTHLDFFLGPVFLLHFQALLSKWSSKTLKILFEKNPLSKMLYKRNENFHVVFRFF
jgi:hypothetical protein